MFSHRMAAQNAHGMVCVNSLQHCNRVDNTAELFNLSLFTSSGATHQTLFVCLWNSHSFSKKIEESSHIFLYICQESAISSALKTSTNHQEILCVLSTVGSPGGKRRKENVDCIRESLLPEISSLSSPPAQ